MPKHSTEHLTDEVERLRHTLLWLIEAHAGAVEAPCSTCAHDAFDHADEEGVVGGCYFPQHRRLDKNGTQAPHVLCECERFT